jgi:glyceraldehyde 3-phosphate dehydrogenase
MGYTLKVAINGFGRIGRLVYRAAVERGSKIDFVTINGTTSAKTLAHLLKYDSNYGEFKADVQVRDQNIVVDGKELKVLSVADPAVLPWANQGIDLVVESTGKFTDREGASKHLKAGAKKVLISAPAANPDATIIYGVNQTKYDPLKHNLVSLGSCTTNSLVPVVKVLNDNFGLVRGLLTTTHAITSDQRIMDGSHRDLRRARSASSSIIPTTTGAAKTAVDVFPELKGRLTGLALRVPVQVVSITDLVVDVKRDVAVEDVNEAFRKASENELKGVLAYTELPLVSVDYKGNPNSGIVDGPLTTVVDKRMVKVMTWYDNEWGFSNRMIDMMELMAKYIK